MKKRVSSLVLAIGLMPLICMKVAFAFSPVYPAGGNYCANADVTLYALWEAPPYTQTTSDVKSNYTLFTIKPFNLKVGSTVILALYNGGIMTDTQRQIYSGENIVLAAGNDYTYVKVMVWDENLQPITEAEVIEQ